MVTEIQDFTGGVNTLVAPHLIKKSEAVRLINSDIRLGSLQSMPNLNYAQSLLNGAYFYEFNNKVYSYGNFRSNVLWDGKWYWSDGVNIGKVLPDGSELSLGINPPVNRAEVIETIDEGGVHTGELNYTYTFYSSTTGVESAPAPLSGYIKVDKKDIELSGFSPLPSSADTYRLYRVGGYLPRFLLVDSFGSSGLPYIDKLDDTQIDGRTLQTLRTNVPPSGMENLVELNGRLFGSLGNKLYYSALGNPDAWYVSDYFITGGKIVDLAIVPAGVLVLGPDYVNLLYGSGPENFRLKLITNQLGCVGKESVAYVGDSVVWLSDKQIVMSNGYQISNLTSFKIDRLAGLYPTGAVSENDVYYISFKPSLFPADDLYPSDVLFPDSIQGTDGIQRGIIAIDFKRGDGFSYKLIEYDDIITIGMVKGNINVSTGGTNIIAPCNIPVFPDCISFMNCTDYALNIMNLYSGQGLTRLYYTSPRMTDNSKATLKQYDKVRINFVGTFNIKIFLGGLDARVDTNIEGFDVDDNSVIIGIPNKDNFGHWIQFEIEGIGIITSVQYSWKFRELVN